MTIPNPTGSVAAFLSGSVTANLDWSNLPAGVYPSSVSITQSDATDATVVQNTTLGLILTDNSPPILQLSETAIPFQAVADASTAQQTHAIQLSTTAAAIPYSATASTLTGSNWLSVSAASGTVPSKGTANVNIAVNPAGLAAGTYFGKVDISAPTAATALQSVEVTLTVATSAPTGPILSATGLLFVAPQNTNPTAQTVTLSTFSSQSITVTGGVEEDKSGTWLKVAAPSTNLVSGAPIMQTVSITTTGLAPGAYTGSLVETTSTASYPIAVVLIVTPSGTCTPTQLLPVITSLSDNFELPAGLPVSMQAQIADDCGGPLTAGAVSLNFSSDAGVAMTPLGNGLWAGTWEPHGALTGVNEVNLSAQSAAGLAGSKSISGTIDANISIPVVAPGGIVSAAVSTLGSILSPGGFISIYGSNLAPSVAQSLNFPLQATLAGTQVFLAGQALPLQFVSAGQINAIVPIETAVNRFQELLIAQNGKYSLPETVVLSAATPAVFSLSQSEAAIIVYKANGTAFVASTTQPATAGDVLAVYCTGLGAVSPAIADGLAAPLTGVSRTVNTVTATIGGLPAQVGFSGLAPGSAGLYQVNLVVPAGITPGSSVAVVLTELGFPSTTLTVAIQ
jgi:uncharacterized protein (TIGR03437 family)